MSYALNHLRQQSSIVMRIQVYGYRTYKYCRRLIVGSLGGLTFSITPTPSPPLPALPRLPHPPHQPNHSGAPHLPGPPPPRLPPPPPLSPAKSDSSRIRPGRREGGGPGGPPSPPLPALPGPPGDTRFAQGQIRSERSKGTTWLARSGEASLGLRSGHLR